MSHVPRGDRRLPGGCNSRDLDVADFHASTYPPSLRSDVACGSCAGFIERNDPAFEVFLERSVEGFFERSLTPAWRENLQPEPHFKDGDRRRPDRFRRLGIDPSDHGWIRLPLHQGGDHIRVKENHGSNTAGVAASSRNSGIS
jgi:hypothetical protein